MSDFNVSNDEITTWLSTIDTSDTRNKRALGSIQLLDNTLLKKSLYYLINGKITIDRFYTMDINNLSVGNLLDSLNEANTTGIDKVYAYRENISKLDGFKKYMESMKANFSDQITRETASITKYLNQVSLDMLGFNERKFSSIIDLRTAYDSIIASPDLTTIKNQMLVEVDKLYNTYLHTGILDFHTALMSDIAAYALIYTDNPNMRLRIDNTSIITWIMREQYLDGIYSDFLANFNNILKNIAPDYNTDIAKLGIPKLTTLNTQKKWSACFSYTTYNTQNLFYENFKEITILKKSLIDTIYGTTYFNATILDDINNGYNNISDYFKSVNLYIRTIINLINNIIIGE